MLSGLTNLNIAGMPIGTAAGGAIVGGVGDALVGVINGMGGSKVPSWAVKGAVAFATIKWGGKLVGKDMAQIGGLFLTYDAIQELFNIRASVSNIVSGLTGRVVKNSPPRFTGPAGVTSVAAPSTVADYYARAEGRR